MAGVVLLASPGASTWVVARALFRAGHDPLVLLAERESTARLLRRRRRRLGSVTVAGQILFQLYGRLAQRRSAGRRREILAGAGLDETPLRESEVIRVPGANAPETVRLLRETAPELVVINGTEILSSAVLNCVDAPFINIHAGITPAYRGVHGGYWALARGDEMRCGATVHLVDAGVDTGGVLHQVRIRPTERDNFFTYPTLQLAAAIPLLLSAVSAGRAGALVPQPSGTDSRQWWHPTIWSYLATGLRRGVW